MILSKSCEYGVRATVYLAFKSQKSEKAGIIEVAKQSAPPFILPVNTASPGS